MQDTQESIVFETCELEQATRWLVHRHHPPHKQIAEDMGIAVRLFRQKLLQERVNPGYDKRHTFTATELEKLNTLRRELHQATRDF